MREGPTSSPKASRTQSNRGDENNPGSSQSLGTSPLPLRFSTDLNLPTTPQTSKDFNNQVSPLAYPSSEMSSIRNRSTQLGSTPRSQRADLRVTGLFDRMPRSDDEHVMSDSLRSDPADVKTVIWGTSINVQESMQMFRHFLQSFTMAHKLRSESEQGLDLSMEDMQPFYPKLLEQVRFN